MMGLAGTIKPLGLAFAGCVVFAGIALAQDLNSYRAQHGKPALSYSGDLAGIAHEHAQSMAGRNSLDHRGYKRRLGFTGALTAENVLTGCGDLACAISGWARSGGHRRNMLRGDVSAYGIASAVSARGRRYWVLILGNPSRPVD